MSLLRTVRRALHLPGKPDPFMLKDFVENRKFTPDVPHLERFDCQKLFVVGEMQIGHPEHEQLGHNMRLVPAAYTLDPFTLWKKKLGQASYAIPLTEPKFSEDRLWSTRKGCATHIRGSLHIVRPYQIIDVLDKHFQNGVEFERVPVNIFWPYREKTETLKDGTVLSDEKIGATQAWMYVGVRDFWDQSTNYDLKPVRMFQPKDRQKPPYYCFTPEEYIDK